MNITHNMKHFNASPPILATHRANPLVTTFMQPPREQYQSIPIRGITGAKICHIMYNVDAYCNLPYRAAHGALPRGAFCMLLRPYRYLLTFIVCVSFCLFTTAAFSPLAQAASGGPITVTSQTDTVTFSKEI